MFLDGAAFGQCVVPAWAGRSGSEPDNPGVEGANALQLQAESPTVRKETSLGESFDMQLSLNDLQRRNSAE